MIWRTMCPQDGQCMLLLEMQVEMVLYKLGSCGEYQIILLVGEHKCTIKKVFCLFFFTHKQTGPVSQNCP